MASNPTMGDAVVDLDLQDQPAAAQHDETPPTPPSSIWKPYEGTPCRPLLPQCCALRAWLLWPFSRRSWFYSFTWGELLLIIPLTAAFCAISLLEFLDGSVGDSGTIASIPVVFGIILVSRNTSPIGFLLGIPFERALWYHKFIGYLVLLLGGLHGLTAFKQSGCNGGGSCTHWDLSDLVSNGTAVSGMILYSGFVLLAVSSLPPIRRAIFEVFYWSHLALFGLVLVFAAIHGAGVILIGAAVWALDALFRYVYLAALKHEHTATLTALPGDIVKIEFPKQHNFEYLGGQYLFVCLPDISLFEWHPFSISSAPHHDSVHLHVKVLGDWSRKLAAIAGPEGSSTSTRVYWEGPYGNPEYEIWGDEYRSMVMVSGGIGVTPMLSTASTVLEQHTRGRELKQLVFVWTFREPEIMRAMCDPCSLLSGVTDGACKSVFFPEYYQTGQPSTKGQASNCEQLTRLKYGRPDLRALFEQTRTRAVDAGDSRVAVMVCGPTKMILEVVQLCRDMSDDQVSFDPSHEVFEF